MKTTMMQCVVVGLALLLAAACEPSADRTSDQKSESGAKQEASAQKAEDQPEEAEQKADEKTAESADDQKKAGEEKIRGIGETPSDQKKGTTRQYGAKFSVDEDPVELASVIDSIDPSSKSDRSTDTVKVSANIEKVCEKKGCWFTLEGDGVDRTVRVKMKDYGFFVPRNTDGGQAILEGKLQARKMTEKEAKHYAKDEGKDPSTVSAEDLHVYEFTASAVQITL